MNEYILEMTMDMNNIEWIDYNKQLKKKSTNLKLSQLEREERELCTFVEE